MMQEDGLCDICRCSHGCCEDHTYGVPCEDKLDRWYGT